MINDNLWNKIADFNLDNPVSEYGFSTRLAKEHRWTKNFTEKAILEYKKFMYLAATSDLMVSPSEIVDTVWHQHLIFTQSYNDLCNLLGKPIQHVPSTHNKKDFEKFRQAKERTRKLYAANFGEPPKDIWEYPGMLASLELPKALFKIRTFIIFGIFSFVALIPVFYYVLRPVYLQIDNPYFIDGYLLIIFLTMAALEISNKSYLHNLLQQFQEFSFIYNLHSLELIYLKTKKLSHVLHATLNTLIRDKYIVIHADKTLELKTPLQNSIEEFTITETFKPYGRDHYPSLLKRLSGKPVFTNVANSMDGLKKYFVKSKAFNRLFLANFSILALLVMLGVIRLFTGLLRDKPVAQLSIVLIILGIVVIVFLWRLTHLMFTFAIPKLYKEKILPGLGGKKSWEWRYFLNHETALAASFIAIVNYTNRSGGASSCGTSCGSSCGSSCSSCGGCGGD